MKDSEHDDFARGASSPAGSGPSQPARACEQTVFDFAVARRRYTGCEPAIDWDAVSGIDLASTPALLARWLRSPERRREEAKMKRWAKSVRARMRENKNRPGGEARPVDSHRGLTVRGRSGCVAAEPYPPADDETLTNHPEIASP